MASKCSEKKVYNPLTKRCVNIDGDVCKALVARYLKNPSAIPWDAADIKKLKKSKLLPTSPNARSPDAKPEEAPRVAPPVAPGGVNSYARGQLAKALQRARQRLTDKYANPEHKRYCQASEYEQENILLRPFLHKNLEYSIPIVKFEHERIFDYMASPNKARYPMVVPLNGRFSINYRYDTHNEKWRLAALGRGYDTIEKVINATIDPDWIHEQNLYIQNLPFRSLCTILGYSHLGDGIVNNWRRGVLKPADIAAMWQREELMSGHLYFPFFFQAVDELKAATYPVYSSDKVITIKNVSKPFSKWVKDVLSESGFTMYDQYMLLLNGGKELTYEFWVNVIKRYADELDKLILAAPKLKRQIVVWRGVKNDYHLTGDNKYKTHKRGMYAGVMYSNNGFISTSMNIDSSFGFMQGQTRPKQGEVQCCLKRIVLTKGFPCLLMTGVSYYNEFEILLPDNVVYYMNTKKQKGTYVTDSWDEYCYDDFDKRQIYITEIVAHKPGY